MYKAAFNRFLFSILLLVFTACGGGGSDSGAGAGSGGEINHAGLTSESRFIAITTPPWTTFPISVSKNSEGKEVLTVVKKNPEAYVPIATTFDKSSGKELLLPIRQHYLSLLDHRIGMLCIGNKGRKIIPPVVREDGVEEYFHDNMHLAKYIFVSNELTEVNYRELFGKTYQGIHDCGQSDGFWGIDAQGNSHHFPETMDADLNVIKLLHQPEPHDPQHDMTAAQLAKSFSDEGLEEIMGDEPRIIRSKAYKIAAGGKTTYVFFFMDSPKHPDPANQEIAPKYTSIHISQ